MKPLNSAQQEMLARLITSMGYELIGHELVSQGRRLVLRLYIDKPLGVTIDDCSLVSQQVSAMMDVEDPFQGSYTLEVSSPGIDRPLFALEHYQQRIGERVNIKLKAPINQRRNYKGVLKAVEHENIHLLVEGSGVEVILPFSLIEKANIIGDVRL